MISGKCHIKGQIDMNDLPQLLPRENIIAAIDAYQAKNKNFYMAALPGVQICMLPCKITHFNINCISIERSNNSKHIYSYWALSKPYCFWPLPQSLRSG